jgi:hypothetical protein
VSKTIPSSCGPPSATFTSSPVLDGSMGTAYSDPRGRRAAARDGDRPSHQLLESSVNADVRVRMM